MKIRKIGQPGLYLIKLFEGFRSTPYLCPAGYSTVGYGHVIRLGESYEEISEEEATAVLLQDVKSAGVSVCRLVSIPLEDFQYDALISFTFNVGGGALQRSTLRQRVNRGEHYGIPDELMKWVWGGGRKLPGLVKRRLAEGNLYTGGEE